MELPEGDRSILSFIFHNNTFIYQYFFGQAQPMYDHFSQQDHEQSSYEAEVSIEYPSHLSLPVFSDRLLPSHLPIQVVRSQLTEYGLALTAASTRFSYQYAKYSRQEGREAEGGDLGIEMRNSNEIYHSEQSEIQQPNSTFSSIDQMKRSGRQDGPQTQILLNSRGLRFLDSSRVEIQRSYLSFQRQSSSHEISTPTRNILQFFWKVLRNFFTGKRKQSHNTGQKVEEMRRIWAQMGELKPSLASFTKLFKSKKMRPYFRQLFLTRYFVQEIIASGLKRHTKLTYLRYVKILLKGFLGKELKYLN